MCKSLFLSGVIHEMQRALFRILLEAAVRLLVHLPVAEYQRPNYLAEFHELKCKCTLKKLSGKREFRENLVSDVYTYKSK
jgi:hypothetical protein